MGIALALALALFIATHMVLLVRIARRRWWRRVALGLALPPLAPWWGWQAGMRAEAIAWVSILVLYAIGVAIVTLR